MKTRKEEEALIGKVLAANGAPGLEVTVSESIARGPFLSLFGAVESLNAARGVMAQTGKAFVERDEEDPEDPGMFCDVYRL